MFLAVVKKIIVDQEFVPGVDAVPAIEEKRHPVSDEILVEAVAEVPAIPEVPLITHEEVDQCHIETDAGTVAMVLASQADDSVSFPDLKFYSLEFDNALVPAIKEVREKSRTAAPVKQTVVIEDADGKELGSGEI